jgi:hypothetical protein
LRKDFDLRMKPCRHACAHGQHGAHMRTPSSNGAPAPQGPTVAIEGCHTDPGRAVLPRQRPQLREFQQESPGTHRPNARDTLQQVVVFSPQRAGPEHRLQVVVQGGDARIEPGNTGLDVLWTGIRTTACVRTRCACRRRRARARPWRGKWAWTALSSWTRAGLPPVRRPSVPCLPWRRCGRSGCNNIIAVPPRKGIRRLAVRQSRARGLVRTHLQPLLTATAMHIVRVIAWRKGTPGGERRRKPGHFARLAPHPLSRQAVLC